MDCTSTRLSYRQTHAFSRIALQYIDQAPDLIPFLTHAPTLAGISDSVKARKKFKTNREVLVTQLRKQYERATASPRVSDNIESLLSENTFTITTAHQNNIFTGPLYFIYKIIHAIRLADRLNDEMPGNRFVPVYYIGSEDADLDELDHISLDGQKLKWDTKQRGAVGRMKIDSQLITLIDAIEGQVGVLPAGMDIVKQLRECYKLGTTVEEATFRFVHGLFAEYGLIVLLPDNSALKAEMIELFEDELVHNVSSRIVEETAAKLAERGLKVQAHPREINLFYLVDDRRERIERRADGSYFTFDTLTTFTAKEMLDELKMHPERFSPNVILRGIYQETILPNVVFIGGGGETAYWLQLRNLFEHYGVPFPVLLLRNSFLLIDDKWQARIAHLGFSQEDIFLPESELLDRLVARDTKNKLQLNGRLTMTSDLYDSIREQAISIDGTLGKHVEALKTKTLYRLQELEKKMLRAEKRKFADQQRQIHAIKEKLFPENGLQERVDSFIPYYARWGGDLIRKLYEHSPSIEQEFVLLSVQ